MSSEFEYERIRLEIERIRLTRTFADQGVVLTLSGSMVDEIIEHALTEFPNMCCGIVAGSNGIATRVYRTKNTEQSPYRYNIAKEDILRVERELDQSDWRTEAIYSSRMDPRPSETDIRLAQWREVDPPMELYPGAAYVFVSVRAPSHPVIRAFRLNMQAQTMEPSPIKVIGPSSYMLS